MLLAPQLRRTDAANYCNGEAPYNAGGRYLTAQERYRSLMRGRDGVQCGIRGDTAQNR